VGPVCVTRALGELAAAHDLVLVEGAGGLLVRYDEAGHTLADMARMAIGVGSHVEVLVVVEPGLGTLNNTVLTMEALRVRDLPVLGVVVGSWPLVPDLASCCNVKEICRTSRPPPSSVFFPKAPRGTRPSCVRLR